MRALDNKLVRNSNRDELIDGLEALLNLWAITSRCRFDLPNLFQEDLERALRFKRVSASRRGRKSRVDVQVGHVVRFDPTIPELAPLLDQVRASMWIQREEHIPLALDLAYAYGRLFSWFRSSDLMLAQQDKRWRDSTELRLNFGEHGDLGQLGEMVRYREPNSRMQKLLSFFISVSQPAWSSLDHFYFLMGISDKIGAPMEIARYARVIDSCGRHTKRLIDEYVLDESIPREQAIETYQGTVLKGLPMLSRLVEFKIGNYERLSELIRSLYPVMLASLGHFSFGTAVMSLKIVIDVSEARPREFNTLGQELIEKLLRELLSIKNWCAASDWKAALTLIVCLARIHVHGNNELSELARVAFERALELLRSERWLREYEHLEPFLLVSALEALAELQVLEPLTVKRISRNLRLSRPSRQLSRGIEVEYHIRCAHAFVALGLHPEAGEALMALRYQVDRCDNPMTFAGPVGYFGHPLFSRVIGTRVTLFRLLKRTCMVVGETFPECAFERLFGSKASTVTRVLDFKNRGEVGFRRELKGLELRMSKILSLLKDPSNGWRVKTEIVHSTIVKTYEVDFVLVFDRCNMLMIEVDSAFHHNVFGDETLGPKGRDLLKSSILGRSLVRVTDEEIRRLEQLTPPEAVKALTARLVQALPTQEIPELVMSQLP